MTKLQKTTTPIYSKGERKAEQTIDKFLAGINSSGSSVLEELKQLSRQ